MQLGNLHAEIEIEKKPSWCLALARHLHIPLPVFYAQGERNAVATV